MRLREIWTRRGAAAAAVVALTVAAFGAPAQGADANRYISGVILFPGAGPAPVGIITATNVATGAVTRGQFNHATDEYIIEGLTPGKYRVRVIASDAATRQVIPEYYRDAIRPVDATLIDVTTTSANWKVIAMNTIPTIDDVHFRDTFGPEIWWLVGQRVSEGWSVGDDTVEYRPLGNVNRDMMAAFLARLGGIDTDIPRVSPFADVPTTHPFYPEIAWMYTKGISTGWVVNGKRYFRPTQPVNRDTMAAFLHRFSLHTGYVAPKRSPFTDVPTTHVFYEDIAWLASMGISEGWETPSGREYRPTAPVKRDVMAAFLYRFWQNVD